MDSREASSPAGRKVFAMVRRNILWMYELVEKASSDVSQNGASPERGRVELGQLAKDVVGLLRPVLASRRQEVRIEASLKPAVVLASHTALVRILLNLLDNASKYGPDGDLLRIRVRLRGKSVVVSVSDHGPGIPARERRSVFRAFHRGESPSRPGAGGLGLGLAVVEALVREHQGVVGVRRRGGETTIWFCLPSADVLVRRSA